MSHAPAEPALDKFNELFRFMVASASIMERAKDPVSSKVGKSAREFLQKSRDEMQRQALEAAK